MVLGIYGSGGAGREVRDIASELKIWDEIVFIDDMVVSGKFKGINRMQFYEFRNRYSTDESEIVIALGEPYYKRMLYNRVIEAGYKLANVVHPTSQINLSAELGKGIIVKAGVVVSSDVIIEDNVSIEENAVIAHDAIIHKHSQISALSMIAGYCEIGEATFIAINVPVRDKVRIGNDTIVGIGSVVINDLPDNVIAYGNPAKVISKRTKKDMVFK